MRIWLAYVDGRPSAVAAGHHHAGVTLVEYVATLPATRGRGAGGRPVYGAMGYVAIERWTAWLRPAT